MTTTNLSPLPVSRVTTTNATPVVIATMPITEGETVYAEIVVLGATVSGASRYRITHAVTASRTVGGAGVIDHDVTVVGDSPANAAWSAAVSIASSVLKVTVTGAAATRINWACRIDPINT